MITIALTEDLAACHMIRRRVFIEEQNVSEADELDDLDPVALHLLAFDASGVLGTARLLTEGETGKIGRVAVLAPARGRGIGQALIAKALEVLRDQPGLRYAKLGAQCHAIGFYEALGFEAYGPVYDDAGIPHRDMKRSL